MAENQLMGWLLFVENAYNKAHLQNLANLYLYILQKNRHFYNTHLSFSFVQEINNSQDENCTELCFVEGADMCSLQKHYAEVE
jgi:hypothetical protein